jgi:hypothetical protein
MADIIRCDGDCGAESPDPKTGLFVANNWTDLMVRRGSQDRWKRFKLCAACAGRDVFVMDKNGAHVSDSGFASDVLR